MGLESGGKCYTIDSSDKHLCLLVFGRRNRKVLDELIQYGLNDSGIEIKTMPRNFWNVACTGLLETDKYELYIVGQKD